MKNALVAQLDRAVVSGTTSVGGSSPSERVSLEQQGFERFRSRSTDGNYRKTDNVFSQGFRPTESKRPRASKMKNFGGFYYAKKARKVVSRLSDCRCNLDYMTVAEGLKYAKIIYKTEAIQDERVPIIEVLEKIL
mgnify:FL=1